MSTTGRGHGIGWIRDLPDHRDFSVDTPEVSILFANAGLNPMLKKALPAKADLSGHFSPIEDQGAIGSCTAHAGVAIWEYLERRTNNSSLDGSRLFLYKATRNLMQQIGDTGAYLRTTMAALAAFGAPPEKYWPYDVSRYDEEPTAFLYTFAGSYKATTYYTLDPAGTTAAKVLQNVKESIDNGLPPMFGFTVYSSYEQANDSGKIPFPTAHDKVEGGHAVVAVGYDNSMKITNEAPQSKTTTGALKIRNSWGKGWGEKGYGWLPYEYVLSGLAVDWWAIVDKSHLDSKMLDVPKLAHSPRPSATKTAAKKVAARKPAAKKAPARK